MGQARRRWVRGLTVVATVVATMGSSLVLSTAAASATGSGSCGTTISAPSREGRFLGIVRPQGPGKVGASCPSGGTPPGPAPSNAASGYNGTPPLTNHGGPVMGTAPTVGEVTITPVYWVPTGFTVPTSYQSIINGFVSNVAADSGQTTNVFAAVTQYTNATSTPRSTPGRRSSTRTPIPPPAGVLLTSAPSTTTTAAIRPASVPTMSKPRWGTS